MASLGFGWLWLASVGSGWLWVASGCSGVLRLALLGFVWLRLILVGLGSGTAAATAALTETSLVEGAPAAALVSVRLGFALFVICYSLLLVIW